MIIRHYEYLANNNKIPVYSSENFNTKFPLSEQTENSIKGVLDTYYLYPLHEITINNAIEDIPKFINERFQTLLSAV